MWVIEERGDFVEVNDAALALYGYERLNFLRLSLGRVDPESDNATSIRRRRRITVAATGGRRRRPIGQRDRVWRDRCSLLVAARDVTDRARLQEQLLHRAFHDPLLARETGRSSSTAGPMYSRCGPP